MATHGVVLTDSLDVTTSGATATLAAAIDRMVITKAIVRNYTASAATLTVWLDHDGTDSGNLNEALPPLSIPADTAWSIDELVGCALVGGGTLKATGSANSTLSMHVVGTTYP